jgi:hypothetical protein
MITNKISKADNLIFFLLNLILFVDAINGYFINNLNHLPIAQFYKLLLISLFIIRLIQQKCLVIILCSIIYISFFLLFYFTQTYGNGIIETLIHLSKFYFTFLSYFYLRNMIKSNQNYFFSKIKTVFLSNFLVLIISIILGRFGFGFSSYENEGIGSKGYFGGANDLGACLFIIFSFIYFQLFLHQKSSIYKLMTSLFLLSVSIFMSTKLAIFGTLLSLYFIPRMFKSQVKFNLINKLFRLFRILIVFLMLSVLVFYGVQNVGILDKWSNNFELSTEGIINLLSSGRIIYFDLKFADYLNSNLLQKIFGMGGDRTAELDFLDALMNYGIVGSILIYLFLTKLYLVAHKFKKFNNYPYASLVSYCNIVLAVVSFVAGHVIFSAMAGIFVSLINSLVFVKQHNNEN